MNGWAIFLQTALAPFGLILLLLIARPFLIAARKLPDGWFRRFLLFRYNEKDAWRDLMRKRRE